MQQDQDRITELLARRQAIALALVHAEEELTRLQRDLVALDAEMSTERARAALPCWNCEYGEDARFQLSNSSEAYEASPSGWPLACCKVSGPVAMLQK